MLAHLLEVDERVFEPPAYCSHAAKSCALELLALEERLCVFEKTDIVARDGLNKMFSGRELTKGDSKVVGVVECVQQVLVERVYVLKPGETLCFELVLIPQRRLIRSRRTEDQRQLFSESLLSIFDLACIETPYPGDLKTTANLCG